MSHSDSELSKNPKQTKKKLHIEMKAKNLGGAHKPQNAALKKRLMNVRDARLLLAAATNNTESVGALLAKGVNPNTVDADERSALHIAASKGFSDVVKILLDHGANPNKNDKLCNTPLHLAACTHNLQVILLLLKAGADVRRLDIYGKKPLQLIMSKLNILQLYWKDGSLRRQQVESELQLIIDILLSADAGTADSSVHDLKMMKLSLNSDETTDIDDQISKLMNGLQGFKL